MVETNNIVLPSHANALGTLFGGVLMSWIDISAAICAQRHSRRVSVTASVDSLSFLAPVYVGDTVTLKSKVVYTGKSSMVIAVDVTAENPLEGKPRKCVTAYLNFVAFDEKRKPTSVPQIKLETAEERELFEWAAERRKALLDQWRKLPAHDS